MQHASATPKATGNYLMEIRRFPMLKSDEEYMLAALWHDAPSFTLILSPTSARRPARRS
jgi:hypothetical protein